MSESFGSNSTENPCRRLYDAELGFESNKYNWAIISSFMRACYGRTCIPPMGIGLRSLPKGIRLRSGKVLPIEEIVYDGCSSDSEVETTIEETEDDGCSSDSEVETTIEETTEEKVKTTHYESDSETETETTKTEVVTTKITY